MNRCPWLPVDRPLYVEYHDTEWGVSSRDERYLFEMICLEGAQAGLSWWTVLQKRERYREVFRNFVPEEVAKMKDAELEKLVLDPGIIRHRGKILAVRENAKAWLTLREREGDPVEWIWGFIGGKPRVSQFEVMSDFPTKTPESDALSKALRKAGFNFVGSTTMYAFMQAVGMVDDHTVTCFRKK
ncbi:DNA-3-methyladenine glycosylase I [Luteolibacter flavescens]|uniref:DNA-3-methyladenine glycosylase I n=1 Tax=Luteolibacter flavescens TaxID=1859460 RepID=A0ABT3FT26_9BACT|nr:DNA-3-methyladenine glycosylase I [Luteolibacter flavescens]MCW1886736.1 DNA-3-methyladenine glycosylase I [Luteolibacter flavescens]